MVKTVRATAKTEEERQRSELYAMPDYSLGTVGTCLEPKKLGSLQSMTVEEFNSLLD
jgi:hypothetical protein